MASEYFAITLAPASQPPRFPHPFHLTPLRPEPTQHAHPTASTHIDVNRFPNPPKILSDSVASTPDFRFTKSTQPARTTTVQQLNRRPSYLRNAVDFQRSDTRACRTQRLHFIYTSRFAEMCPKKSRIVSKDVGRGFVSCSVDQLCPVASCMARRCTEPDGCPNATQPDFQAKSDSNQGMNLYPML